MNIQSWLINLILALLQSFTLTLPAFLLFFLLQTKDVLLFIKNVYKYYMNRPENKIIRYHAIQGSTIIFYYTCRYVRYQNEKKFLSSIFGVVYFHSSLHLYNNVGLPAGTNNAAGNSCDCALESFRS